jgi:hypothetical protein
MLRLVFAVLILAATHAAADPCDIIPPAKVFAMLGTTKNKAIASMKPLPSKAIAGQACSYAGTDNSATVIWYKFSTPAAARDYLKTIRESFEDQNLRTTSEKFAGEDGFSFNNGMLAVKKTLWFRVNVNSTAGSILVPDLTRQLMLEALKVH